MVLVDQLPFGSGKAIATRTLPLFVKHVKPIKVARSRLSNQLGTNEWLIAKVQTKVSATDASVLREVDSGPGRELGSFVDRPYFE
jgi:hypothetical protein